MAGVTLEVASNALDASQKKLVNEYVRLARIMWNSLTPADWWNDAVVYGAAARLSMLELALIGQVRRLGIAYANQTLRMVGVSPKNSVMQLIYPRVNTDPWLVAARPADSYRSASVETPDLRPTAWPSVGDEDYEEVSKWITAAFDRLQATTDTNTQIASTSATLDQYKGSKVLSYRRVLHPELSRSGSCGLCVVAADRWYSTDNLMPMHNHCHCGVAPAGSDYDPGFQLNNDDLRKLYNEAGGNKASDLANVRVQTITHGELGPVLSAADARATPKTIPNKSVEAWHTPDRQTTLAQYERMKNRAIEFGKRYKQVSDSGEEVKFRYEGRNYTFKPSTHLKQAWAYQRSLLNQMQSMLGTAA
ncbi:hypothetical protein [Bifidobacterium sp. SO1]|uniref:hypothetical protein n=1 Tax=Bifidobacterium sp. SO1 TaxID=2809029 RepID=UPI001BDC7754|nr:hypothetical protein [Bifidobacterium sp. SO1]MBT1161217.1 hypothetical protein [Bifidobacterium sp. SO1]